VYGRGDHADKQANVALADTWLPNFGILQKDWTCIVATSIDKWKGLSDTHAG